MAQPRPQAGADLAVHRARATGWRGTRGEVARWLEAVPVASLGLGPDEWLYLPRVRVRVPGHQGSAPGRMSDRITAELRALLVGADSGWAGGFSPGRAYRFTSRGRYFAWLVALWVKHGSASARAAFHTATGETSLQQWQRANVLQDGIAFVATVARLAEIGCAARWIARLEPAEIALAQRALEHHFAIQLDPATAPVQRLRSEAELGLIVPAPPSPQLSEAIARLETSGNDWHGLPASGKALLLAAVMLARNPSRSTVQVAALGAAIIQVSDTVNARSVDPTLVIAHTRPPGREASGLALNRPEAGAAQPAIDVRRPERPARRPARSVAAVPTAGPAENPAIAGGPAIVPGQIPTAPAWDGETHAESALPMAATPSSASASSVPSRPIPFLAPDRRFETCYGGLFFLLNAFTALGLYPDFTQPKGARLDPSPLWLADRIGRFWFGARYRGDPLAAWIAANAASGALPRAWRAEPDWLTGFETPAGPRHAVRRGRTTLWHPAGFPLIDEEEGRAQLRPHQRRRGRVAWISPVRLPPKPSDRWAACLALYLDARLRLLCGAGLAMLALPARIQTRDLDISARFALDGYPIQLRIAGLDRDPGWQPAEGRTIAFVFE